MNDHSVSEQAGGPSATVFGFILIVLGILCMLTPGLTGLSVAVVVGFLVLFGGATRIVWAFRAGSLGRGILSLIIGALTLIAGLMLVTDPLLASGFLTVMLAAYLILDGIAEVLAGNLARPLPGSGWLIFGGIVSILLGVMIWSQYPLSGAFAIGTLLGIKLFLVGIIMVTGGSSLNAAAR